MLYDEIRVASGVAVVRCEMFQRAIARRQRGARYSHPETDEPRAQIVVWSDMFDPNHNAMDHYDLVRGSLAGSWKGLTSDVIIANWNVDRAAESLKWFGALGHRQIIGGYYDSSLDNYKKWDVAARGVPRVEGFIYTTWEGKYDSLEEYGKALLPKSAKIP